MIVQTRKDASLKGGSEGRNEANTGGRSNGSPRSTGPWSWPYSWGPTGHPSVTRTRPAARTASPGLQMSVARPDGTQTLRQAQPPLGTWLTVLSLLGPASSVSSCTSTSGPSPHTSVPSTLYTLVDS